MFLPDGLQVVAADLNSSGSKDYVVYRVRVADDVDEWTVSRRYRNFETLHKQLKSLPGYRQVEVFFWCSLLSCTYLPVLAANALLGGLRVCRSKAGSLFDAGLARGVAESLPGPVAHVYNQTHMG